MQLFSNFTGYVNLRNLNFLGAPPPHLLDPRMQQQNERKKKNSSSSWSFQELMAALKYFFHNHILNT